jgi:hypothetical protein
MERIGLELGVARPTLCRWQKRFGWRRPAPPDRIGPSGGAGPCFFRSRRFSRPYGGDAVSTARDLVLGSNLTSGRIAARAGISRSTLWGWTKRGGWTRAVATGRSHPPYGPDVVAAARELYEGTELSVRLVAARAKTTPERVRHWARTKGWIRLREWRDPDRHARRRRTRRRVGLDEAGWAG